MTAVVRAGREHMSVPHSCSASVNRHASLFPAAEFGSPAMRDSNCVKAARYARHSDAASPRGMSMTYAPGRMMHQTQLAEASKQEEPRIPAMPPFCTVLPHLSAASAMPTAHGAGERTPGADSCAAQMLS